MKQILFFLLLSLSFTSCIEIMEEVNLNADGSGSGVVTVNLSASKDNLKSYMDQGSYEGNQLPTQSEMEAEIEKLVNALQKVEGLSNVQSNSNFEDFVFKFSGDFKDIEVLNSMMGTVAKELSNQPLPKMMIKDNFRYDGKEFKRLFDYPIDYTLYDRLPTMQRFILENTNLVSIYRFKQPVKQYSNRKARLSPTKKALMMMTTFAEIMKGETKIENTVSF